MQRDCVLITGAAKGIGKEIALTLAAKGYDIALNYSSSMLEAEKTAEEIRNLGVRVLLWQADVSKFDECEKLIAAAKDEFGQIFALVNNAGVTKDGMMMRMSQEAIDQVIDINLKGALYCARHISGVMLRQKRGRIINISSIAGVIGNAGQMNYSAAKAGMIGLGKAAARELAPRGITVNTIAPGLIESDMTRAMPEEAKAKLLQTVPLGRMGEAKEVAELVAFLCSDAAAYITGQTFCIDGGLAI